MQERHLAFESFIYFDYLVTTILLLQFYHFAHKDKIFLYSTYFFSGSYLRDIEQVKLHFALLDLKCCFLHFDIRHLYNHLMNAAMNCKYRNFPTMSALFLVRILFQRFDKMRVHMRDVSSRMKREQKGRKKIVREEKKKKIRNIRKFYFIFSSFRTAQKKVFQMKRRKRK